MAEFIMKEMVRKAGLALRIDSAAVSYEEEGNDIYPPAKRTLLAHGVPFQRHRAHRVSDAEAFEYDIIVVMDSSNRRLLSHIISPENMTKVHMMMEYAGKSSDVSDPWYTGDFERTYRDIAEGCEGLLRQLSAGGGIAGAIAVAEKGRGGVRDAGCEDGRFTEGGVVAFGTQGARWAALHETQRAEV